MNVNCPNCGEGLELPDDIEPNRHILCPYCDKKFSLNVSVSAVAVEEKEEKPSAPMFTTEEVAKAAEIFEKAQFEKTSPWKRRYKGNVWIKAIELFLIFGSAVLVRDFVKGKMPNLLNGKDYVAEVVASEIKAIGEHNEMHIARMKGYSLDFVITADSEGHYPYLWAEKEPERVWNTIKVGLGYMEDHLKWLKEYRPQGHWDYEKAQARYDRFNNSRAELFDRTISFYEAQVKLTRATRKLFSAYYLTQPNIKESTRLEINRLYPSGLKDIDSCVKEFGMAIDECAKEESSYYPYVKNFKWKFDKLEGKN